MTTAPDPIQVEFAINFEDQNDINNLSEILQSKGLKLLSYSLEDRTVLVQIGTKDTSGDGCYMVPFDVQGIQKHIEKHTGLLVVVKGLGRQQAAVAEISSPPARTNQIFGVVRLSQLTNDICYVDCSLEGYVDLLDHRELLSDCSRRDTQADDKCQLTLAIHEFGDLSDENFDSIGEIAVPLGDNMHRIGNQKVKVIFHREIAKCDISKMLGKSVALTAEIGETQTVRVVLGAAVLARASEVSRNDKKMCACSGKTIWEERRANL